MTRAAAQTVDRALGVDVGTVRVGVAASDPSGTIASPIAVLRRGSEDLWRELVRHARERDAALVVVGLPRQLDGGEGEMAADARAFAADARDRLGLPVVFWDERFTSVQAEAALIAQGVRRDRRRGSVDAVAATLLLQSWLDAGRPR